MIPDWTVQKSQRLDGREELICKHGVGHTTYESAVRCAEMYKEWERGENPDITRESVIDSWFMHGCDGCCRS